MIIYDKSSLYSLNELIETARKAGAALLVDKDTNWTSFDVVAKIRSLTRIKKIGHAGTLDPLATGLLIVCIGKKATKEIYQFQNLDKTYIAEIKLGATTKTDDSEAEEENPKDTSDINDKSIRNVILKFIGKIEQIPPDYSAKKINGKPAYKLARKDQEVILKPSIVEIFSIEIQKIELPFVFAEIKCSKGTYIRSLARDIGSKLGCGAYLKKLRRSAIGNYNVENALNINDIIKIANNKPKK